MGQIIAINKKMLYWENTNGQVVMNGNKARNLFQSMVWLSLAKLDWGAEKIAKYQDSNLDFKNLLIDTHSHLGTEELGTDPQNMTRDEIIQAIEKQCPKMSALLPVIGDVVYLLKINSFYGWSSRRNSYFSDMGVNAVAFHADIIRT